MLRQCSAVCPVCQYGGHGGMVCALCVVCMCARRGAHVLWCMLCCLPYQVRPPLVCPLCVVCMYTGLCRSAEAPIFCAECVLCCLPYRVPRYVVYRMLSSKSLVCALCVVCMCACRCEVLLWCMLSSESVPLSIKFRSQNTCNLISYLMRASLPLSPRPTLSHCVGASGAGAPSGEREQRPLVTEREGADDLQQLTVRGRVICAHNSTAVQCAHPVPALVCTSQEGKKAGVQQQLAC